MAPAMPCKISKNNQNCGMVINTVRTNQNLRLFWKPVNLQGRVWENLYRNTQMTAAKVMDIISRVQGCAAQADDAVSEQILPK